jgi:putative ABC transport system substrate-binding protein
MIQLLIATGLLICVLTSIEVVAAQPDKRSRIGILFIGGRNQPHLPAFEHGLREHGYIEGKNIALEYRYAEGQIDRLPSLAAELVQLKVAVIVTTADIGARAAKQATKTTPIVITTGADLVQSGLADSLAKPGGNVTGLSVLEENLSGKRLELFKEAFPKASQVGYLWNPSAVPYSSSRGSTSENPSFAQAKALAQAVALQLRPYQVRTPDEIEEAFAEMSKARPDALLVILSPLITLNSRRIVERALEQRLPGVYPTRQFAEEGGLMAYGPLTSEMYRRAASYVDKILRGAKPAELPVEQPTKFDFIINLRTAKQIGVTIPPNVLARADKVIR